MAEDGAHKPLVSAESAWAPSAGAPPAAKGPVADHEPAALSALAARYPQTGTDAVPEETYAAMLSRGYFAIRDAGGGPPVPYLYGLGAGPPLAAASYEVVAKDRTECWWRLDNGGGERGDECVHPGILFSLLDYCVSWAAGASIAEPTVTAAISIGFAPASRAFAGGWVRVVAGGQPSGPRRVSARGTLEDAEGRVLATAVGSFARFTVSKV
ncbi:hypothetical protein DFJ74DRAFT_693695 [Hyaloraphidium curvatum]|nr:hypothetical protein DFJ74DRAFT_693695 [Hyaloraphidium curvatum]